MIGGLVLKHLYTKVGICKERVLVGSNPPTRITHVFHARLKGPMIPCCGVWVLTGNLFAAWEIISIIFAIFCYFGLLNSECDLGVHVRGHSSILQIWWGWPVTSHVISLSLSVSLCKWDNHLIHQALCTCTQSLKSCGWSTHSSSQRGKETFGSQKNWVVLLFDFCTSAPPPRPLLLLYSRYTKLKDKNWQN